MSAKAISEQTGKELLYKYICTTSAIQNRFKYARVTPDTDWAHLLQDHPWLLSQSLVVKPDQLIKRRGKLGLVGVNLTLDGVKSWLKPRLGQEATVGKARGFLKNFLIEPFVPHTQEEEFYVCIYATREGDYVLFHHEGGVDVGDVDAKAQKLLVGVDEKLNLEGIKKHLLVHAPKDKEELSERDGREVAVEERGRLQLWAQSGESRVVYPCLGTHCAAPASGRKRLKSDVWGAGFGAESEGILASFISGLFNFYEDLYFTYLEINPLVVTKDGVYVLDLAAKVDATADYICKVKWGDIEFPPPFGREAYPEEAYIADLDAKSGASLKLTLLNPKGRIWTMVAGGGASVVYSDTICDLGGVNELANYGEYSGAPSEQQTYDYAKTILSLMTREKHPDGKILIIGGSIANFTNVAATFKGIVRAIRDYQGPLKEHEVTIFVRRGGPNYQEGLRVMGEVGKTTGIPIHVFGTETHMTAIVGMALGHRPIPNQPPTAAHTANFLLNASGSTSTPAPSRTASFSESRADEVAPAKKAKPAMPLGKSATLFSRHTKAIVWGMQTRAVQGMLDFDYVCSRDEPSVAAMVYPFTGDHKQKFYWGHKEILIPVFKNMADAMKKHPEVDVLISFASLRSAYDSTMETMNHAQIRTIAIIAEGIPEALTRKLIKKAEQKGVTIIGPATVGGIKPGCFKIGNTGGMLDNILASKLYRPGSVAYVSRSGGMSNELNNIISRTTDGVYEGVAIGGDSVLSTGVLPTPVHTPHLTESPAHEYPPCSHQIGGTEEYKICRGIKEGRITKPVVCWCIGTCATMFSSEVQFGHAGACANQASETAVAKNQALKEAGVFVPRSFDELGEIIQSVYEDLVARGVIIPAQEVPPPTVPMDYSWARELGLIRKPASFMTSICDERGQELIYAGMPITEVFKEEMGIGGVLGLLWFQKRLPKYSCQFIEMCLMVTADHGPAVSGAHNTIICARAGKDLVSSLTSGLLTIINNPDMRVQILKDYVRQHFPATPLLDYALEVEKITTSKVKKKMSLMPESEFWLNFSGKMRAREEADEYIDIGALNGIFVLGRSMGFIGHYLDQKRLKQGLYRHPWDDISYVLPEHMSM
ncbi:hypothetical protein DBR06_SOUSAS8210053 [Sousa chinensis]|uniref:ATP-citrate synthase n=1 Tax=Sousa chinensis TaxID=103600 RepID=A0A484GWZ8_SOUCH|nr:hypothetical protein DBR06_SOUSAS8210053 [Sousa chinensis]